MLPQLPSELAVAAAASPVFVDHQALSRGMEGLIILSLLLRIL